jgi:glycerol-3-phosphate dehydrogenase subunit C
VLEHNGFFVHRAEETTCCGMPNLDGGDVAAYVAKVKQNVAVLHPHVAAGRKIVVPGPTCGYTMKKEWAEYVDDERARAVAAATLDLMEFLVTLGKEKRLVREFEHGLGRVAYHAACHLRAQKIGFPGARVLGVTPEADVRIVEQCSAVDGTWGMKAANYETGRKYAQKLVRETGEMEPDLVVSDCGLAGIRITQETGARVIHPVEALAEAYGLDTN